MTQEAQTLKLALRYHSSPIQGQFHGKLHSSSLQKMETLDEQRTSTAAECNPIPSNVARCNLTHKKH